MKHDIIAILGPTASGKTKRAVQLATHIDAEIISADSRQIYRDMDIGTGKDLSEYGAIPHHLIDICPAGYKYNLHEFIRDFYIAKADIQSREKKAIICGGTGLYMETVLSGIRLPQVPENQQLRQKLANKSLDELKEILSRYKTLHNTTDLDTSKRAVRAIEIQDYYRTHPDAFTQSQKESATKLNAIIFGIDIPRDIRREKITQRLHARIKEGMIDEIKGLISGGISPEDLIYYGLEYKFVTKYVIGEIPYKQMISELEIAIHQFAKRQMTWFRGMEKRGFKINWLPYNLSEDDFILATLPLL